MRRWSQKVKLFSSRCEECGSIFSCDRGCPNIKEDKICKYCPRCTCEGGFPPLSGTLCMDYYPEVDEYL